MAVPLPKRHATESDVDAVIQRIDDVLPRLYQRAEDSKKSGQSPSDSFSPEKIKQTREEFEAMSEDKLLTRSGEDIVLDDESRKPQQHTRPKLFFRRSG